VIIKCGAWACDVCKVRFFTDPVVCPVCDLRRREATLSETREAENASVGSLIREKKRLEARCAELASIVHELREK
jgi:hypothetical protein